MPDPVLIRRCPRCNAALLRIPASLFGGQDRPDVYVWQREGDPEPWKLSTADPRFNVHRSELEAGVHCGPKAKRDPYGS